MKFFFFFFTLLTILISIIVGSTYLIFNLMLRLGFKPGTKAWDKLIQKLRIKVDEKAKALVPWDNEMLHLLSINQMGQKKPSGFSTEGSGTFLTIYQEPVLTYALQGLKDTGVLLARTSDREFIFRFKGKETEIWVNKQPMGVLVDGVLLSSGKNSRQLARLAAPADESQSPVVMGEKTAAAITNPAKADTPNPRALTLLRDLTPDEENALLALAIIKIVR